MITQLLNKSLSFLHPTNLFTSIIRNASKKVGTSSRNRRQNRKPKHYGIKKDEGSFVTYGTMIVKQRALKYHPGLHVGLGRNGNLFAMENGRVIVTSEKADLDWNHSWVQRSYSGKQDHELYKYYFHVIPVCQEGKFKLIDQI